MELSNYIRSDGYAAVIETDHGVMINGVEIPHVIRGGVECRDTGDGVHEVTIRFLTDSFIRLAGKPSEDFKEGISIQSVRSLLATIDPKVIQKASCDIVQKTLASSRESKRLNKKSKE